MGALLGVLRDVATWFAVFVLVVVVGAVLAPFVGDEVYLMSPLFGLGVATLVTVRNSRSRRGVGVNRRSPQVQGSRELVRVLARECRDSLGRVSEARVVRLLDDERAVADVRAYVNRYLVSENRSELDTSDESFEYFAKMMANRYGARESDLVVGMMVVHDDIQHAEYSSEFSNVGFGSPADLLREAALSDVYADRGVNLRFLVRLGTEKGVRMKVRTLGRDYGREREGIKLAAFESGLHEVSRSRPRSVEDEARTQMKRARVQKSLCSELSTDAGEYVLSPSDWSRESRLDTYYRKHFSYVLSKAFDGHCSNCAEGMRLEFDHFWIPKSAGGNFLMRAKSGSYVNNCIPLCRQCNSSKGARDFREFFDEERVLEVVRRSQSINRHVNESMRNFVDPEFLGRAF